MDDIVQQLRQRRRGVTGAEQAMLSVKEGEMTDYANTTD